VRKRKRAKPVGSKTQCSRSICLLRSSCGRLCANYAGILSRIEEAKTEAPFALAELASCSRPCVRRHPSAIRAYLQADAMHSAFRFDTFPERVVSARVPGGIRPAWRHSAARSRDVLYRLADKKSIDLHRAYAGREDGRDLQNLLGGRGQIVGMPMFQPPNILVCGGLPL
jgi:hypothetical protein